MWPASPTSPAPTSFLWVQSGAEHSDYQYSLQLLLWFVRRQQQCFHHCFCTTCVNQHGQKSKEHSSIIMEIVLTLWTPWKSPRDPQGFKIYTVGKCRPGVPSMVLCVYYLFQYSVGCWINVWLKFEFRKPCLTQYPAKLFCTKLRNRYLH